MHWQRETMEFCDQREKELWVVRIGLDLAVGWWGGVMCASIDSVCRTHEETKSIKSHYWTCFYMTKEITLKFEDWPILIFSGRNFPVKMLKYKLLFASI